MTDEHASLSVHCISESVEDWKLGTRHSVSDIIARAEMALRQRYDLDAEDAHALLVKVSEQQSRSINTVALAVIERFESHISAELTAREL